MPYKMTSGKWRAKRMIDGQVRTKSFETKQEAKKWEAEQSAPMWHQPEQKTVTVLEWANEYLDFAKERFSAKTYHEKRAAFARLLRGLPNGAGLPDLRTPEIMRILRDRSRGVSGHAANKDRKNLGAAWEWGRKHLPGWPETPNPFRQVERFAEERSPRYVPPEADFWAVIARGCTRGQDRDFLLFMLYTAARRGELFRLQWQDVDLEQSRLRLSTRKRRGGSLESDWVPLAGPACDILRRLPRVSMLVFTEAGGGRFNQRARLMKKLCARAGVKPFGFHAIRHLSASILAREGVPLPVIQGILRHKAATTTSLYLKSLGMDLPELDRVWVDRKIEASKVVPLRG